jgi:phage tail-like protein
MKGDLDRKRFDPAKSYFSVHLQQGRVAIDSDSNEDCVPRRKLDDFEFRVRWDGKCVAGVSKISALRYVRDVVERREGDDSNASRKSPGRTRYEPITLERAVTRDTAFEDWAKGTDAQGALCKDVMIELLDEAGLVIHAIKVFDCWVSEYQAFSQLAADSDDLALEMIRVENAGWQRLVDGADANASTSL